MSSQVVSYELDDETVVQFEVEPSEEWHPVGAGQVVSRVRTAVEPAVQAARTVMEQAKEFCPDEVQVKFGVKVNGTANWLVAKAATEANFEITMTWRTGGAENASTGQE
ncbi:CU044_2847 family protein [Streptomyces sp. NPDC001348]